MISLLLSGMLIATSPVYHASPVPEQRVDLTERDILPFALIGTFIGFGTILLIQNRD